MRLIINGPDLVCPACRDQAQGVSQRATAVIGDDIPGGFVQENFGHAPETFYSKQAMAKRAKALGLMPFVRHRDGDTHTSRWI
jgi:hypothetical protein